MIFCEEPDIEWVKYSDIERQDNLFKKLHGWHKKALQHNLHLGDQVERYEININKLQKGLNHIINNRDNKIKKLEEQNRELLYALNDMALMVNPIKKNEEGVTKYYKAMDLIEKVEGVNR